jgi:mannosyltransferase OCH1-like enzyme
MSIVITPKNVTELDHILNPFVESEKLRILDCTNTDVKFPRIIHQVWFNSSPQIKDDWSQTPYEWQRHHPGWVYILWNEQLARKFIKKFEPKLYIKYKKYKRLIQRCDAIRCAFLKRYGGLYVDLDTIPKENITSHITSDSDLYLIISPNARSYTNSFMISKPGCSFWDVYITEIINAKPIWTSAATTEVMFTTGPIILNRALKKWNQGVFQLSSKFAPVTGFEVDAGITTKPDAVVICLPGKSWYNYTDWFGYYVYKYRYIIIALLIIIMIFLMSYFIYSFIWYKDQYKHLKISNMSIL